ncbi:MAG TPA: LPXTG cell wall anchor domain-containing protein [Terriglobia bacterium]|nr:LPXTG cell wall anchor domain-containing protein [Terriglobia bacterium]
MRTAKLFVTLFCITLLCSIYSPQVKADEWDKKTIVTFSGPVDVSGHRLEAGTYVFKLADSPADRHIVQIFNADESHIIATILAIPDWRVTPTDKTTIKFSERAGDVSTMERDLPEAGIPIKEWFYPGDNFGQEFRVKPAPVLAENTAQATTTETTEAAEPAPAPAPEEKPVETAQAEPAPAPEPAQAAPAEPAPAEQPAQAPAELPQTASSMPLFGLIGLASLGASLLLQQIVKRMA